MRRYRGLLRTSVAARLIVASVVARFPLGMTALALILLVQREFGGLGTAGLVTGCFSIVNGLGAPVRGRCVDRFGPVVSLLLTVIRDADLGDRCRESQDAEHGRDEPAGHAPRTAACSGSSVAGTLCRTFL
jgi:MFS family permease